ncbi:TPA: hypothetical protein ACKRQA_001201 [Proteus mirabilis]|uniref:hypothetical protein n=1 Tax=Proteus mirabilis TaxID=584 RepID=UPI001BA09C3A|nr:hypothetical protein [Proteus mirabilis]ELA7761795.1 hypothetical protein [Proteus mirabilis]HBC5786073.1 hypothetical protein [Proteus mirabilis]HEI8911360.1 hypothetical protein [Proteus mirabilis]
MRNYRPVVLSSLISYSGYHDPTGRLGFTANSLPNNTYRWYPISILDKFKESRY